MNITIEQSVLARELALLAGVAAKNSTIPILSSVKMEAADGQLRLTATDLECGLVTTVPCRVVESGAICLPAKRLLDLSKALTGDIKIATDAKNYAAITAGRSRSKIPCEALSGFPDMPSAPSPIATLDARAFSGLLDSVKFCVAPDVARGAIHAVRLEFGATTRATAFDGNRMAYAVGPQTEEAKDLLLPHGSLGQCGRITGESEDKESVLIAINDNHIFLTVGPRLLICRQIVGMYPSMAKVLDVTYPAKVTIDARDFKRAISLAVQFAESSSVNPSRFVILCFSTGEVKVMASSATGGEGEQSVSCDYTGEDVSLRLNSQYLTDILGAVNSDSVSFLLRDAKSAIEIQPCDDSGTRYIAAPARM